MIGYGVEDGRLDKRHCVGVSGRNWGHGKKVRGRDEGMRGGERRREQAVVLLLLVELVQLEEQQRGVCRGRDLAGVSAARMRARETNRGRPRMGRVNVWDGAA
jgi:hypothetical protein